MNARRCTACLIIVAACGGKQDDCAIVREAPAEAMAEINSRYPGQPVKVAETIERCIAPSGDECERIAKIVAAMPALAPQVPMPRPSDYAATCREAPVALRRCLLPSYMLGHADECKRAMTEPMTTLDIKPMPKGRRAPGCDGFASVYVTGEGVWLATGRDAKSRCFAPRTSGALDVDWLARELRALKALECPASSIELAAAADVPYRDVIQAMDVSVQAGILDVGISPPSDLAVPLATADPKAAAADCPATVMTPQDRTPSKAVAHAPNGRDTLQTAPVVIVTKDHLSLRVDDKTIDIGSLADARSGPGLAALTSALPPTRNGALILQAHENTPATVIDRIVAGARAAGYDNVLFAVKNK